MVLKEKNDDIINLIVKDAIFVISS